MTASRKIGGLNADLLKHFHDRLDEVVEAIPERVRKALADEIREQRLELAALRAELDQLRADEAEVRR